MNALLDRFAAVAYDHVYIERQQAMPKQGVSSTFSTGYGFGLWIGMLVALRLPYTVVGPREWQKDMLAGTTGDTKARSILRALQLYPGLPLTRPNGRKPTLDGVADAALIATYGLRLHG
jgi:hypothetical protein